MKDTKNIVDLFKNTPESFSGESKILRVNKDEVRTGIILDDLKDFVRAIRIYSGENEFYNPNEDILLKSLVERGMVDGIDLVESAGRKNEHGFVDNLIDDAVTSLRKYGGFKQTFDYDAMGTKFFKSGIECVEADGKYVLNLRAARVGSKPEKELRKKLGKKSALLQSVASANISVVDDWWFNFNIDKTMSKLPVSTKCINSFSEFLERGTLESQQGISFDYGGEKYELMVDIGDVKYLHYLKEINPNVLYYYIQARDNHIVGGAWKEAKEKITEEDYYFPNIKRVPIEPSLNFSVSLPRRDTKYSFSKEHPYLSSPQRMEELHNARDYISELIMQD